MTEVKTTKTVRQSNLELLRIVAMIMIIGHHYACHGGSYYYAFTEPNIWMASFFMIGGKVGVNVFILITGYFMSQKQFDIHRLAKLELGVLFYSILFFCVATFVLHINEFDLITFLTALFPSVTNLYSQYWFIPCYFGLILLAPFINKMIAHITRRQFKTMIMVLLLFTVFFPGVLATEGWYDGDIAMFFVMYLIGAYVRTYNKELLPKHKWLVPVLSVATYLLMWAATSLIKINVDGSFADLIWCSYGILPNIVAVFMFFTFLQIDIGNVKWINRISATTLGIYLIHDNLYVREYIWKQVFYCPREFTSSTMWLHAVKCIAIVFVVCTVVELLRSLLFYPLENVMGKMKMRQKINKNFNGESL